MWVNSDVGQLNTWVNSTCESTQDVSKVILWVMQHVCRLKQAELHQLSITTGSHPMRTEYWNSSIRPRVGTKRKRHARRRGAGLTPMPTAIMPMYSRDRMLVARNAASSSENMVISKPQFCTT